MVTETQIDALVAKVVTLFNYMNRAFITANSIKLITNKDLTTEVPINPMKFRTYTQAERDTIFADVEIEILRIKGTM